MPVTAPTPACVRRSRGLVLLTSPGSSRTPPCGRAPTRTRTCGPGRGGGRPAPAPARAPPPTRMVRDPDHQPQSVEGLALSLPAEAWEMISWREGSADLLISRFARVRVRAAHRAFDRSARRDEEWLLVEWPTEEEKPTKFWLATLPENVAFDRLVALAKLRWRLERAHQDLHKQIGPGQLEARGWRGFHPQAILCIAA